MDQAQCSVWASGVGCRFNRFLNCRQDPLDRHGEGQAQRAGLSLLRILICPRREEIAPRGAALQVQRVGLGSLYASDLACLDLGSRDHPAQCVGLSILNIDLELHVVSDRPWQQRWRLGVDARRGLR